MLWNIPFLVLSIWYSECFYILKVPALDGFPFMILLNIFPISLTWVSFLSLLLMGVGLFLFSGWPRKPECFVIEYFRFHIFCEQALHFFCLVFTTSDSILCHAICWWGLPLRFLFDIVNFSFPVFFQISLVTSFLC